MRCALRVAGLMRTCAVLALQVGVCVVPLAARGQAPGGDSSAESAAQRQRLQQLQSDARQAHSKGLLPKALESAAQALLLEQGIYGSASPQRAASLELYAQWQMDARDYAGARASRREALEILERLYGSDGWQAIDARLALGDVDRYERFTDAEHQSLLEVEARHGEVMRLYDQGRFLAVLPLAERNVRQYAALMGTDHPNYANLLNNLASIDTELARFDAVDELYEECIRIGLAAWGDAHPGLATAYQNLGRFAYDGGDYERARSAFVKALEQKERFWGATSPEYAATLHSLAATDLKLGRREEAMRRLDKCLAIAEKSDSRDVEVRSTLLNNLAGLQWQSGRRDEAKRLYEACAAIRREAWGEHDPRYAAAVANLAAVQLAEGDAADGEDLLQESLSISAAALGDGHPQTAAIRGLLGEAALRRKDFDIARGMLRQALVAADDLLRLAARSQSQRQELVMRRMFRTHLDRYLALALVDASSIEDAYEYLLAWKGATLVRHRDARRLARHPEVAELFARLQTNVSKQSALALGVASTRASERGRQLTALRDEQERLERRLSQAASESPAREQLRLADVRSNIPQDAVLVDFIECQLPSAAGAAPSSLSSEGRLLAFIVQHDGPVRCLDLASSAAVARDVATWRQTLGDSSNAIEAAKRLRESMWEPLRPEIDDAATVLVSPDGALCMFPLAALPGKDSGQSYLLEDVRLATIPIPQLIAAKETAKPSSKPQYDLLLAGGIDYSRPGSLEPLEAPRPSNALFSRGDDRLTAWPALPGAEAEIAVIKDLFSVHLPGARIAELRGTHATEQAFRELAPKCQVLHVATHGFFRGSAAAESAAGNRAEPDSPSPATKRVGVDLDGESAALARYESGLVFAGANELSRSLGEGGSGSMIDDGMFTDDEAALVPLSQVKLAILSACDTGLGEATAGEGLLGIQRSFQMAGARATIASLWKVNDLATRRIMEEFYRNCLRDNLTPLDSLRAAQLWALRNPDLVPRGEVESVGAITSRDRASPRLPPKYWAAFTLSGDWR